jgi:tetratricopeptide (TPR) repeat protein
MCLQRLQQFEVKLNETNMHAEELMNEGKYDEASNYFSTILHMRSQILGGEHEDTLSTMNKLAKSLLFIKCCKEAVIYYKVLLHMPQENRERANINKEQLTFDIAEAQYCVGNYVEALARYEVFFVCFFVFVLSFNKYVAC